MFKDYIALKWGILKRWKVESEGAQEAYEKCMENENKETICALIDAVNCEYIYLDWDGKYVSKDEAKKYVMDYPRE